MGGDCFLNSYKTPSSDRIVHPRSFFVVSRSGFVQVLQDESMFPSSNTSRIFTILFRRISKLKKNLSGIEPFQFRLRRTNLISLSRRKLENTILENEETRNN